MTEICLESRSITNRRAVDTDDLVINKHKLNPFVYEATDLRQVLHDEQTAVGGFSVLGTVMVKAWDQDLKRYVMIRRLVRTPLFSPLLNLPEIPAGLKISDPTNKTKNLSVEEPAAAPVAAAATKPSNQPASTSPAESAPSPAPAAAAGLLQEGAVWGGSWEDQPPSPPAGYEWHRRAAGGYLLVKAAPPKQ